MHQFPNIPHLLLLAGIVISFSTTELSGQEDALTLARTSLTAEDPSATISALDSLQETGKLSPALYQGLGNAYYDRGENGRAILAYEKGLRLSPGNRSLINNLKYVRGEAAIDRPEIQEFFLIRGWRSLGAFIGVATAKWLALIFWALAVAGTTFWYLRREGMAETRRFALLPLSGLCFGLAVLFYLLGSSRQDFLEYDREAILVVDRAELRVAPGPDATLEESLSEGLKVRVLDEFEAYVKVSMDNGRQGWVPVGAIEKI